MNTDHPKDDNLKLIRLPEVVERTGLARPTIYRAVAREKFPKPVKFGSAALWVSHEVESWIRARMNARVESAAA